MRKIYTGTGKPLESITLDEVMKGNVRFEDIKISKNTLEEQAKIAIKYGNVQQAENFKRASEMMEFNDEEILEMYNKLRPNRSTERELEELVERLKLKNADICAKLVSEALEVYKKRGILLKD